jgi:hypothetical protein
VTRITLDLTDSDNPSATPTGLPRPARRIQINKDVTSLGREPGIDVALTPRQRSFPGVTPRFAGKERTTFLLISEVLTALFSAAVGLRNPNYFATTTESNSALEAQQTWFMR